VRVDRTLAMDHFLVTRVFNVTTNWCKNFPLASSSRCPPKNWSLILHDSISFIQSITRGITRKTLPLTPMRVFATTPYHANRVSQPQNHAHLETSSSNVSHPCAKKILAGRSHLLSMLYRFPGTKSTRQQYILSPPDTKRDPELECGPFPEPVTPKH